MHSSPPSSSKCDSPAAPRHLAKRPFGSVMIQTPFGSPNPKAVPQARPSAARPRERLSPTATYRTRRQLGRHPSPFAMAGLRPIEFGRSLIDGRKDETSAAARLRPGGEARVPRPQPPAIVDDHGQPQARLLEARDGDRRHSPDHLAASGMEASARVAPRALCGRGARSKVRDRHESPSWQTRCSSMPPTRKRRGWWWSAARRSRSSTSKSASRRQLRGNIYLAKVTRVEPSLQAAFVEYGGNRHGFLAFSEIHPDYYQIPVADRQALLEEDARAEREEEHEEERRRHRRDRRGRNAPRRSESGESVNREASPDTDEPDQRLQDGPREPAAEPSDESPSSEEISPAETGDESGAPLLTPPEPGAGEGAAPEQRQASVAQDPNEEAAAGAAEPGREPGVAVLDRDAGTLPSEAAYAEAEATDSAAEAEADDPGDHAGENGEEEAEPVIEQVGGRGDALEEIPERPAQLPPPIQDPGGHQAPADPAGPGRQGGARHQGRGAHHLSVACRPLLGADAEHRPRRRHLAQDHERGGPQAAQGDRRGSRGAGGDGGHPAHRRCLPHPGRDQARFRVSDAPVGERARADADPPARPRSSTRRVRSSSAPSATSTTRTSTR